MPRQAPTKVSVRTYDVGFGDCFLLTFHYASRDRHVLIDFGSMRLPTRKTAKGDYLIRVAEAIREDCSGKLDALVATHRHQDHISGFARREGRGPGEIIRALKPSIVIQPWTEDPQAPKDATAPSRRGFTKTLLEMQHVAAQLVSASKGLSGERFRSCRAELAAVGMDNIANPDAVANLQSMAPNRWVCFGSNSGLGRILPGVKTTVLGPPTVDQSDAIRTQRKTAPDEFWQLTTRFWRRFAATQNSHNRDSDRLFPGHPTGALPRSAGWLRYMVMQEQANSLLSIVRMLDKAMNNTSVILLFEVAGSAILFPGDAQYENWMYALSKPAIRRRLAAVNLYKVGHHGSLNATPKTLWNGFTKRGSGRKPDRLRTLLSTMKGVHGSPERKTEVPRTSLLNALEEKSDLTNTQAFKPEELRKVVTLAL